MLQNLVDGVDKTHVEHLVGFVEDYGMHVVELHHPAVYQVDKTARSSHDYLHSLAECVNLALNARTAVDGKHRQPGNIFREIHEVRGNLEAELARGRKDKRLRHVALHIDALEHRQPECSRLARARLSQRHNISLLAEQMRNHLLLNGHRSLKTQILYRMAQRLAHAQFFKRHNK